MSKQEKKLTVAQRLEVLEKAALQAACNHDWLDVRMTVHDSCCHFEEV